MAESRKVVKVFLASPGDLADERRTAKVVVDEFNALYSEEFGYQVELVGWEDTVSVYGRPQAIINRELERCELFVGMIWKRWGTTPDTAGPYTSGFEEEFDLSIARRKKERRPEISLFFKEVDPEFLRDPGDDLKKVLSFREKLIAEKAVLFENFVDAQDFEKKLRRCISRYVITLRALDVGRVTLQTQAPAASGETSHTAKREAPQSALSLEGSQFISELVTKSESDSASIRAVEVARFRLLAHAVGQVGNDEQALGVHDANLLFTDGRDFTFGDVELNELVDSGLEHFSEENTPLWHWLRARNGFVDQLLPFLTIFRSEKRRRGAIQAMNLIGEQLPPEQRVFIIDEWFSAETPVPVKVAAIAYLAEYGNRDDLPRLKKEFDINDYQTTSAAADAIIRINLRDSRERAILALYDLQPANLARNLLEKMFEKPAALATDLLLRGIAHQSPKVRHKVAQLLRARRALPQQVIEQLLSDNDAAVRFEAIRARMDSGQVFSEEEAKAVLIRPSQSGGLASIFGVAGYDSEGDACWRQFKRERLAWMPDAELAAVIADDSIYDQNAYFAFTERHFKEKAEQLRHAVDDEFRAVFSSWIQTMTSRFGRAEFIDKTRSMEDYVRKTLTRRALDILARNGEPDDLPRVRVAMKTGFVDCSIADVEYLRKFGEWENIPLIIEATRRSGGLGASLLSASDNNRMIYSVAARAILALAGLRLAAALEMDSPSGLTTSVIRAAPDKSFRAVSDTTLKSLLRSEHETVRKFTAVKCVRTLAKKRLSKLLDEYLTQNEYRFYNVSHWLDLGISAPSDRARRAADKVLQVN